jgi:hypothetical protein
MKHMDRKKPIPYPMFWPKQLVPLAVAALLPFLPAVAIEIPLKEVLSQVLKLVM